MSSALYRADHDKVTERERGKMEAKLLGASGRGDGGRGRGGRAVLHKIKVFFLHAMTATQRFFLSSPLEMEFGHPISFAHFLFVQENLVQRN